MELQGTFWHPALGVLRTPAGLTGAGLLRATREGLLVSASKSSQNAISVLGCFGAILGFFLGGWLGVSVLGQTALASYAQWTLLVAGALGGAAVGKLGFAPKPFEELIPWIRVKDVAWDGLKLVFRLEGKPSGMVHFEHPDALALGRLLEAMQGYAR